jgi:hypothetical protein
MYIQTKASPIKEKPQGGGSTNPYVQLIEEA